MKQKNISQSLRIEQTFQFDMTYLKKHGFTNSEKKQNYTCKYDNGKNQFTVNFCATYKNKVLKTVFLSFYNMINGNRVIEEQSIEVVTQQSNLGRGQRLYFKCPVTGLLAMKLHKASNSAIFKHRCAYNRLYYNNQLKSKRERNCSYLHFEKQLALLEFELSFNECIKGKIWTLGKIEDLKHKIAIRKANHTRELKKIKKYDSINDIRTALLNEEVW